MTKVTVPFNGSLSNTCRAFWSMGHLFLLCPRATQASVHDSFTRPGGSSRTGGWWCDGTGSGEETRPIRRARFVPGQGVDMRQAQRAPSRAGNRICTVVRRGEALNRRKPCIGKTAGTLAVRVG